MRCTRTFLAVLAVPLLAVVGCGDDDDDTSSATTSSAPEESTEVAFADEVNAICAESGSAMGEIFGPMAESDGPPSQDVLQSTYDALLAQLQGEQADLEALTPPADQQDDWDALVAAHADAVAVVEEQGLAYFDDEESNTFAEVEAMAVDMGFEACGGAEG